MSCGVGRRHGSDQVWLRLWCRLTAGAPIRPLAWEPPHATGAALKRQKTKTNKKHRLLNNPMVLSMCFMLRGTHIPLGRDRQETNIKCHISDGDKLSGEGQSGELGVI